MSINVFDGNSTRYPLLGGRQIGKHVPRLQVAPIAGHDANLVKGYLVILDVCDNVSDLEPQGEATWPGFQSGVAPSRWYQVGSVNILVEPHCLSALWTLNKARYPIHLQGSKVHDLLVFWKMDGIPTPDGLNPPAVGCSMQLSNCRQTEHSRYCHHSFLRWKLLPAFGGGWCQGIYCKRFRCWLLDAVDQLPIDC